MQTSLHLEPCFAWMHADTYGVIWQQFSHFFILIGMHAIKKCSGNLVAFYRLIEHRGLLAKRAFALSM